jgi:hypothetical protein
MQIAAEQEASVPIGEAPIPGEAGLAMDVDVDVQVNGEGRGKRKADGSPPAESSKKPRIGELTITL